MGKACRLSKRSSHTLARLSALRAGGRSPAGSSLGNSIRGTPATVPFKARNKASCLELCVFIWLGLIYAMEVDFKIRMKVKVRRSGL